MAATRGKSAKRLRRAEPQAALSTLTLAALALPGLGAATVQAAEGDSVSTQFSSYQEGSRDLGGLTSNFDPIQAQSTQTTVSVAVSDTLRAVASFSQDTWSGATPVATAPQAARGNRISAVHVMTGASGEFVHGGHGGHGGGGGVGDDTEYEEPPEEPPPQTLTGASPYLYSSLRMDAQRRPLQSDSDGAVIGGVDNRLLHTLSSASPEMRRQFDLDLEKTLGESRLRIGAGISRERDYDSSWGHLGGSRDFDRKLTTLSVDMSYTASRTHALLDHDAVPHVYEPYMLTYERRGDANYNPKSGAATLLLGEHAPTVLDRRQDWSGSLGLTRIINRSALLQASAGFTHSKGDQSNPYKAVEVAFIDPLKQQGLAGGNAAANYYYDADVVALMEQRPRLRNQGTINLRYVQHVGSTDAAMHLGYRYYRDSWGIDAHTLAAEWVQPLGAHWTVTPRLRYYTQDAAKFFVPYLVTDQGLFTAVSDPVQGAIYLDTRFPTSPVRYYEDPTGTVAPPLDPNPGSPKYNQPVVGPNGRAVLDRQTGVVVNDQILVNALTQYTLPFDRSLLPEHYSSDARLAGYGTLGMGITLARQFDNGMRLELGFDHMRRAGALRLGGNSGGGYADYGSWLVNLALTVDLGARMRGAMGDEHDHHHMHDASADSHAGGAPAAVMLDHVLDRQGDVMVGYRFAQARQRGDILHDGNSVDDYALINGGCEGKPCYVRTTGMSMRMHMLDIMYAATDRLTLMLMPQFMDMHMTTRLLEGSPRTGGMDAIGMAVTHHSHDSAGLGDTEVHALYSLARNSDSAWHIGLGLNLPTGRTDLQMRPMMANEMGYMDYGMQLGSGTWDAKPSLTYSGSGGALAWGAQLGGTVRLASRNAAGYALGDALQATAWSSYSPRGGWSASLRGVFMAQGKVQGGFDGIHVPVGAANYTGNYGGRFLDIGVGLAANVGSGPLAGSRWSMEWLQPVSDLGNGYQLERKGALSFSWGLHW